MYSKIMQYLAKTFFQKYLLEAAKESRKQFFLGLASMAAKEKKLYIMMSPKMGDDMMAIVGASKLEEDNKANILSIVKEDSDE